jgi:hypothetical protein
LRRLFDSIRAQLGAIATLWMPGQTHSFFRQPGKWQALSFWVPHRRPGSKEKQILTSTERKVSNQRDLAIVML